MTKGKMYVATIIPAKNVEAAKTPVRDRLTKEDIMAGKTAPLAPYRVKGQKVRAFSDRSCAEDWVDDNATEHDRVTIRRWKPGKGKKRRWRGATRFG